MDLYERNTSPFHVGIVMSTRLEGV
jgi:hypothetical protein